jgi:site-specific DNA-methyltransferase (adenine-specific)
MIEITNEDNMALMARYPDRYFDLAIVDPPYGMTKHECGNYKAPEHISRKRTVNSKAYSWAVKYSMNREIKWDVAT